MEVQVPESPGIQLWFSFHLESSKVLIFLLPFRPQEQSVLRGSGLLGGEGGL